MSGNIRPSEISDILLSQLKEIDTDPRFDEVGTVLQVPMLLLSAFPRQVSSTLSVVSAKRVVN